MTENEREEIKKEILEKAEVDFGLTERLEDATNVMLDALLEQVRNNGKPNWERCNFSSSSGGGDRLKKLGCEEGCVRLQRSFLTSFRSG